MDNITGDNNDRAQGGNPNALNDSLKTLRQTINTIKKVVKYARFLANFIAGGWPIVALIASSLLALAFYSIVFGQMAPMPGGSIPKIVVRPDIAPKIPGLTLKLTGPIKVGNGDALQYTIEVAYIATKPPLSNIIVYEVIPPNTTFSGATGAYTYGNGEIVWPMSQNEKTFTFTLTPTTPDIEIKNQVYVKIAGGTSDGTAGSPISPSTDSCGGGYNLAAIPIGANFGDPNCDFNKDDLYTLLQGIDPTYADKWYGMARCESSYYPLAYNAISTSGSAWGLLQMGHIAYPEFGIANQTNNEFDRGDVDWRTQVKNAIEYNRLRGDDFAYWHCQ